MFVRWNFTVCSATQSSLPIASFDRPRASAFRIDASRSVSPLPSSQDPRRSAFVRRPIALKDGRLERLPDRRRQIDRAHALDDVGARAALERSPNVVLVTGSREHDDLDCGVLLADPSRQASPSIPGMRRSSSTRSGFVWWISGSTWAPSQAVPTTTMSSADSSASRTPSTINLWSSATRTLIATARRTSRSQSRRQTPAQVAIQFPIRTNSHFCRVCKRMTAFALERTAPGTIDALRAESSRRRNLSVG